ncbi:MAG: MFS transporter [Parvibaculaceae bacterium]
MHALLADRKIVGALLVLAVTQIIGWGTVGIPAIVGREMARDLGMTVAAAFAGTSVLYVAMGLIAPVLARLLPRHGARPVMAAGAFLSAPGFVLLSVAQGPVLYYVAWAMLGLAGGAALTTSAYALLSEVADAKARSAIGALMLATGLSNSVFWPVTAFTAGAVGWRGTALVYALLMVAVCTPLYVFGLPRRESPKDGPATASLLRSAPAAPEPRGIFAMVIVVTALYAFTTFGLGSVFVELLKARGLSSEEAIAFGSFLGVIQVGARVVDFIGGDRWDGITTGLFAGSLLPVSMLVLLAGGSAHWAIVGFIMIYGLGAGAMAVARATIPLVFYEKAAFARTAARIALPINLISALAPPIFVALLVHFGSTVMIAVVFGCSCLALALLFLLRQRRPMPIE